MAIILDGTNGITTSDVESSGPITGSTIKSDTYLDASGGNTATINGIPLRPGVLDPENRIINGAFDFWQRGTSQTSLSYASADRWRNEYVGGTVTMSRQSFALGDTLGSNSPTFFLRQTVSGQSLSSHNAAVQQRIEGVRSYAGQTITVLGWARRSSGTGNMALELVQLFGTGGSPSADVTGTGQLVTLTGSWTAFAVTFAVPSITGKTLGTNNDDNLVLLFYTSAGSTFNTRAASLGLQTIAVDLWGIHIKVGTHTADATSLYRQPELGPELARCQRYYFSYQKSFTYSWYADYAGRGHPVWQSFPVTMRAAPTALAGFSGSINIGSTTIQTVPAGFAANATSAAAGGCQTTLNLGDFDSEL